MPIDGDVGQLMIQHGNILGNIVAVVRFLLSLEWFWSHRLFQAMATTFAQFGLVVAFFQVLLETKFLPSKRCIRLSYSRFVELVFFRKVIHLFLVCDFFAQTKLYKSMSKPTCMHVVPWMTIVIRYILLLFPHILIFKLFRMVVNHTVKHTGLILDDVFQLGALAMIRCDLWAASPYLLLVIPLGYSCPSVFLLIFSIMTMSLLCCRHKLGNLQKRRHANYSPHNAL